MKIECSRIKKAEQILIDNGIEEDEAKIVLQALGYTLLDEEIYPTKYRARCIQWDRTDDDGEHIEIDLPSEVVVDFDDLQLPDNATDEEIEDAIAVYLTDNYGCCHSGFFFDKIETIS